MRDSVNLQFTFLSVFHFFIRRLLVSFCQQIVSSSFIFLTLFIFFLTFPVFFLRNVKCEARTFFAFLLFALLEFRRCPFAPWRKAERGRRKEASSHSLSLSLSTARAQGARSVRARRRKEILSSPNWTEDGASLARFGTRATVPVRLRQAAQGWTESKKNNNNNNNQRN